MSKSNRKKRHRVKPVDKMTNYYISILKVVADGETNKSENEIFNALQALNNNKGLKFKQDAIDSIHILSENQILKISRNENHSQKYDVHLAPLGDELICWWKNIERGLTVSKDLEGTIKNNFVIEQDVTESELKAKLLSKHWKLKDISSHDEWLEQALDFMIKTSFVFILTLITSYMRLLSKINDNELAKAILNYIFSDTLKQCLSLPISKREIFINDVLLQMELPIIQYFVDYCYNKDLHGNTLLEGKPHNLLNSICSMIEPGMDIDTNFNSLVKYIMALKEKNVLSTPQDLPTL